MLMKSLRKILRRGLMLGLAASVGVTGSLWGNPARFERDAAKAVGLAGLNANDSSLLGRFSIELLQHKLRHNGILGGDINWAAGAGHAPPDAELHKRLCGLLEDKEIQDGLFTLYKGSYLNAALVYDKAQYVEALTGLFFSSPSLSAATTDPGVAWGANNAGPGTVWAGLQAAATGGAAVGGISYYLNARFVRAVGELVNPIEGSEALREAIACVIAEELATINPECGTVAAKELLPHSLREHLLVRDLLAINGQGLMWHGTALVGDPDVSPVLTQIDEGRLTNYMDVCTMVPMMMYGVPGKMLHPSAAFHLDQSIAAAPALLPAVAGAGILGAVAADDGHAGINPYLSAAPAGVFSQMAALAINAPFPDSGGFGAKFPQLLGARLHYKNANPLAAALGLFRRNADDNTIKAARDRALAAGFSRNPAGSAKLPGTRNFVYEQLKGVSLHHANADPENKLGAFLGGALSSDALGVLHRFNAVAHLEPGPLALQMAREVSWQALGQSTTGRGKGLTEPQADEAKAAMKVNFDAAIEGWKANDANIPFLAYKRTALGQTEAQFLADATGGGPADKKLSKLYIEPAPAANTGGALARHILQDAIRMGVPSLVGARAWMTHDLQARMKTPEYWAGFTALLAHGAGIRRNALGVALGAADGDVAGALNALTLEGMFDLFVDKSDAGVVIVRGAHGDPYADGSANATATKALVSYILSKELGGVALDTRLDHIVEAEFLMQAAGPVLANLTLANVRDAVIRATVDYLLVQHGFLSAGDFILAHRNELAWTSMFTAANVPGDVGFLVATAVGGGVTAAANAQALIGVLFTQANDAAAVAPNAAFRAEVDMAGAVGRLPYIKNAFKLFDDLLSPYIDAHLTSIYGAAGGNFNAYRRLDDRDEATHGMGAGAQPGTYRTGDFLELINARAPQKRNEELLAARGVWDRIQVAARLAAGSKKFGDIDDAALVAGAAAGIQAALAQAALNSAIPGDIVVADTTKLHPLFVHPSIRLHQFLTALQLLGDDGAAAVEGVSTAVYPREFLREVADCIDPSVDALKGAYDRAVLAAAGAAAGPAERAAEDRALLALNEAKFEKVLDGIILFESTAATTVARLQNLSYYLGTYTNPVVKRMAAAIKAPTGLIIAAGDRPRLEAAVEARLADHLAARYGNIVTLNAVNTEAVLQAAVMSLENQAGAAANVTLYAAIPFQRMLPKMLDYYFKRGGEAHLRGLAFNGKLIGDAAPTAEGINDAIAAAFSNNAVVNHANSTYPGGYKKLITATGGLSAAGTALFVRADGIDWTNFPGTLNRMQVKLTTVIENRINTARVTQKAKDHIERVCDASGAMLAALKTWAETLNNGQCVPGLNLMHTVLASIDNTVNSLYQRGKGANRVKFGPLYLQNNGTLLDSYALASRSWNVLGQSLTDDEKKYATESLTSQDLYSASLVGAASNIYNLAAGGVELVAGNLTHAIEAAVGNYLVGCAAANADLSMQTQLLFGPVEKTWFYDGAAKVGEQWAYDGGAAGNANLRTEQKIWLDAVCQKLDVRYGGLNITGRAAFVDPTMAGAGLRTHDEVFRSIKRYAPMLCLPADMKTGPAPLGLDFAGLKEQVAAFRKIHSLYTEVLPIIKAGRSAEGVAKAGWEGYRATFAAEASSRLFDLLYAGVTPSVLLPAMEALKAQLSAAAQPTTAGLQGALTGLNDAIAQVQAHNPAHGTIVGNLVLGAPAPGDIVLPTAEQMNNPGAVVAPVAPVAGGGGGAAPAAAAEKKADVTAAPVPATTKVVPVAQVEAASPASFATAAANSESLSAIPETVSASVIAEKADKFVSEQMSYTAKHQVVPVDVKLAAGLASFSSAKNVDLSAKPVTKMKAAERLVWNALGKEQAKLKRVEAQLRRTKVNTAAYKKLRADKVAILNTAYKAAYAKEIAAKRRTLKAAPAKARASVQRKPAFSAKKPAPAAATVKKPATNAKPAAKPVAGKAPVAKTQAPVKATTPAKRTVTTTKAAPAKPTTTKPAAKPVAGKAPVVTAKPAAKPVAGKAPVVTAKPAVKPAAKPAPTPAKK